MKLTITLITLFLSSLSFSQDSLAKRVTFLFVGDVMQHGGQIAGAYNAKKDSYDYRDCFQFVKPIISGVDIALANLEATHAGKPYKGYPQFSAPPELSEALVDAGFDVIVTANNHACDGGGKGVVGTLDQLDKLGVQHTGTFRSKTEREKNYPLMVEKNGLKIAVLNYTYGTNGLTVASPLIINYIDSTVMKADFRKAKMLGADVIICTVHWGEEYKPLPNGYQKEWEAFCYREGADMVIGSHPHVLEPVEAKTIDGKDKLTAWSLGNFVSNQRDRYKDGGMMLGATVSEDSSNLHITDVHHYFTWVFPRQEAVVKPYYILPEYDYNAVRPGFIDAVSLEQMKLFFSDSKQLFNQHSKGTVHYDGIVDRSVTDEYELLLKGYYALEYTLPAGKDWKKLDAPGKTYFHKVLAEDGDYHLVAGMCSSVEQVTEIAKTLETENYLDPKIVFISPNAYKIISE